MKKDFKKFFTFLTLSCLMASASESHAVEFQVAGMRLNKPIKTFSELKRKNVIFQSLDFSCGAAGLSTLLNYYFEKPTTEQSVIEALFHITPREKVIDRKGFSLLDLKKLVEAAGYKASGYKMDIEYVRSLGRPVLVPIDFRKYKHFVIVKAVIADRVFIADPAAGNVSMKIDQFLQMWTSGVGLVIEDPRRPDFASDAMRVKEEDFLVYDYKRMQNLLNQTLVRTAVYAAEF